MASTRGRPALKDLLDDLGDVFQWETLGVHLDIKKFKLREIKAERRENLTLCKMDMFDYWLRSNVHASWEKIVLALEKMDEHRDLAHSLRVKHRLGPSPVAMEAAPEQPMQVQSQGHSSVPQSMGAFSSGSRVVTVRQESGVAQSSNLSQVVSALAEKGFDVNAVDMEDDYRQSILQKAVYQRDLNTVKAMVALGANVNYADSNGITALDIAVKSVSVEIAELLKTVGGHRSKDTSWSSMDTSSEEIRQRPNVLCLDSSSDKVVVQLEILNRIELMTGRKITDIFEYFVGGGIGGLLLLAMVYANKSVSQLIKLYYQLWLRLNSEFDSRKKWRALEDFTHDLFGSDRMYDASPSDGPKVLIAAVNRETTRLKLQFFTNFSEGRDARIHVYRVASYTCATPEYYNVIRDDTDHFIHGGAICRNLTASALTYIAENSKKPPIMGVVSVGEGIWSAKQFTDETDLSACAMDAMVEQVHENCERQFSTTSTYYRVNPLFPEQTPVKLRLEDLIDLQINTIAALIGEESAASELSKLTANLKA